MESLGSIEASFWGRENKLSRGAGKEAVNLIMEGFEIQAKNFGLYPVDDEELL